MNRSLLAALAALSVSACLNINDAREGGARRWCDYENKCGDIGSGQTYASYDDCLTRQRSDFLNYWPTSQCDGKVNGTALDTCYTAIQNTQCNNFIDQLATLSKCTAGDVCSGGGSGACNCGQGQTCCNGACVNLSADRNNCGTCGSTCGAGASCQSGACR